MKKRFEDQKLFKDLENQTSVKPALTHCGLNRETRTEFEKNTLLVNLFM